MTSLVAYRIGKPPAGTPKPVVPPAPPKPVNDASHALLHGSDVCVADSGATNRVALLGHSRDAFAPAPTIPRSLSHVLIIAALLTFATGISAQEPASAILPAGEIREAIQELRESSKANRELAGEAKAWRTLWERFDGKRLDAIGENVGKRFDKLTDNLGGGFSRFLDRIGNGLLLICGTVVLVGVPFGLAALIKSWKAKT